MVEDAAIAAGAVAASLLTIWKVVIPVALWSRRQAKRVARMVDVVVGVPAVADPDRPGELLSPAVPDIGVRVTAIEDKLDIAVLRHVERAEMAARRAEAAAERASHESRTALEGFGQMREQFASALLRREEKEEEEDGHVQH